VGITFKALLDPFNGVVNTALASIGVTGPGWLTDPTLVLYTLIGIDVWKGVGLATLIYMAGLVAIPSDYYEAARIDGATGFDAFWNITLPLVRPATTTVVILSLIGGLRSFDLIWATTNGGPGFSSDVMASVIFKQYQAGFYGLSTAGNVVLFLVVTAVVLPLFVWMNRRQADL
jgi:raffinose/stachyose/melibiose transport system permease protein